MPVFQRGFSAVNIILGLLILILIGAGGYFWGAKNFFGSAPVPTSTAVPSPASSAASPSPSPSPSPTPSPSATIKPELLENIKASVASKNTAALEGYMADTVNVIVEATECCGNVDKITAINEVSNIANSATAPWNFEDDNPIAIALRQKNPSAFPDGVIIGTSANRKLITFTLNAAKTKIIKVYTAVDYKLQLP